MITLGSKVRDKISGFEGIATSRTVGADGSVQFGIQPRVKKDEVAFPKAMAIDEAQLEIVAAPDSGIQVTPYVGDIGFKLGELVEDRATGLQGIAMERLDFINGCCYVRIQPKGKKDGSSPDRENIEHFLLKRVGPGISKITEKVTKELAAKPATETSVATPRRSGGPSVEVIRGK